MSLGNKEVMAKNIQYYMDRKGIDRNTLCADLNLKYMTVSDWINAKTYPRIDKIELLANYFNISKSDLVEEHDEKNTLDGAIESIVTTSTQLEEKRQENVLTYAKQQLAEQRQEQAKKSNVIEFNKADEINEELYPYNVTEKSAAAKSLSRGYSYNPDFNETFTVYSDYKTSKHYDIATQVVGDSMEPKYPDGDIVLIQKGYDNWNGGVYVVDYDGMTYLKKVFLEENQFRLVSINPKYDDIIIDVPVDEDIYFNIVGRVVDSFTPVES